MADSPTVQLLKGKAKQTQGKLQEAIAELRIQRTKSKRDEVEEESIAREEEEKERIASRSENMDEDW